MFRPRIGQQIFLASLLGLVLSPAMSWAATVTIPAPFVTDPTLLTPPQAPYSQPIGSLSVANSISINNNSASSPNTVFYGTLDLKNNDLIIQTSNETQALAAYAQVTNMVRSGYFDNGNFDWAGTGITSSTVVSDLVQSQAATNPSPGLMALGVILNDDGQGDSGAGDGSGLPIYSTFDGEAVNQYAVLVKYTLLGDTDLSGVVDGFDIATVKTGRVQHLSGWVNGAFQYGYDNGGTGTVDGADIAFSKTAIIQQHQYPFNYTPMAELGGSAAVPEPSSLLLVFLGMSGLAGLAVARRKRK